MTGGSSYYVAWNQLLYQTQAPSQVWSPWLILLIRWKSHYTSMSNYVGPKVFSVFLNSRFSHEMVSLLNDHHLCYHHKCLQIKVWMSVEQIAYSKRQNYLNLSRKYISLWLIIINKESVLIWEISPPNVQNQKHRTTVKQKFSFIEQFHYFPYSSKQPVT